MEELTPKFNDPCDITDFEFQMSFTDYDGMTERLAAESQADKTEEVPEEEPAVVEAAGEPLPAGYFPTWRSRRRGPMAL